MKQTLKRILRAWIPPVLNNLRDYWTPAVTWSGDYPDWQSAAAATVGYDAESILEQVAAATRTVESGKAVYERDGVLLDKIHYSWPVLAGLLQAAAMDNGNLRVLDIGGALGSSYRQNRQFLDKLPTVKWCVVEQENFVACGKREFETATLKFFASIEEATAYNNFNVVLLSSVLPYLENPYAVLSQVIKLGAATIIIDRTPVLSSEHDRITIQKIPDSIYHASYPAWFLSEEKLLRLFQKSYAEPVEFQSLSGKIKIADPRTIAIDKGYIYIRK